MPRWYCPHLRASCPSTPPGKSCCQPPRYPNSPTPTPGPLRTKTRCRYNQAVWSRAETQGKRQEGTAHWPWPHPSSTWDPPGGARGVGSPQPTLQRWGERRRPLPSQPGPTCHQLCSRMKSGAGGSEKLGLKTKGRPFNGSWVPLNPNSLSSIPATPGLPSPPPHWAGAEKGLLLTIRGAKWRPARYPGRNLVPDLRPPASTGVPGAGSGCLGVSGVYGKKQSPNAEQGAYLPGRPVLRMGGGQRTSRTGTPPQLRGPS